jgi:hypothetical protein
MGTSCSSREGRNYSEDELEDHRQRACDEQKIFVFTPEQRERYFTHNERLILEAFAIRVYGKRGK